jgi:hypothetical protein
VIGYIPAPRPPRDWVANPPRFRTLSVYGHAGAWAYPLDPEPDYSRFRVVLAFREARVSA